MASRKTRKNHNHSIQHLLELPSNRESKVPGFSTKEHTLPLSIPTPRQVPVTVLHPFPKKVSVVNIENLFVICNDNKGSRMILEKFVRV